MGFRWMSGRVAVCGGTRRRICGLSVYLLDLGTGEDGRERGSIVSSSYALDWSEEAFSLIEGVTGCWNGAALHIV